MQDYMDVKLGLALFAVFWAATNFLTPKVMQFARAFNAVDRGGYRKVFQGEMPLLGGLAVAVPFIVANFIVCLAGHIIIHNWQWIWLNHPDLFSPLMTLAQARTDCLTVALGATCIISLGIIDDTAGMRPKKKLLGQLATAVLVCLSGYVLTTVNVPFLGPINLGIWVGGILTTLWIVGLINAFNLIDGIDGLAAGIALVGVLAFIVLSAISDNLFLMTSCIALSGSLLGYLRYNFPPARIFLGDTGSMFLGFILAMMSLLGAQKAEAAMIIFAPILALGFPIFETFVSITRRYLRGVPIFVGDNRHTHHRLLRKGYSQPKVVLMLYATAALLASAAVFSALVPPNSYLIWVSTAFYVTVLALIAWFAGYLRPTKFNVLRQRRNRNKIFQAFGHYASMRLNACSRSVERNLLLELCRQELGLRRIEIEMLDGFKWMAPLNGSHPDPSLPLKEKLRVKSSDGRDIYICYDFISTPDDIRRQDVSSCLAAIFDELVIAHVVKPKEEIC